MAPEATTTATTTTTANGVAKTGPGQKSSGGDVHLSTADVIQLEHEYGAHKYVALSRRSLVRSSHSSNSSG